MATNFSVKIGEIGLFTFIRRSGIPQRIAIPPLSDDVITLCVNLVNCGPVSA